MFAYKFLLTLQNIKLLYCDDNVLVGYSIKYRKYKLFTISDRKLVYFDEADNVTEVKMKLQVLKGYEEL